MMLTQISASVRKQRSQELLDLVGLGHRSDHTPDKLSGGEQQRVAIGVALANQPPLLLADEPTGELDDQTAGEILDLFGAVNREMKTTVLIVTHDPEIAHKVDRAVMIRDGKMSTEIRRRVTFRPGEALEETGPPLEEFTLVDGAGRVQIPGELLRQLKIKDKARIDVVDGTLTISSGDD
jgi:ABC-type glutathione transport system ATPase component